MMTRDTSIYRTFRTKYARGKPPSLKKLAQEELGLTIQENKHSSVSYSNSVFRLRSVKIIVDPFMVTTIIEQKQVEDAKTCMLLFRKHKREWEQSMFTKTYRVAKKSKSNQPKNV